MSHGRIIHFAHSYTYSKRLHSSNANGHIPVHQVLHALPTSLILHTNLHRRLRELLLRLALRARLVLLACRLAADVLCLAPSISQYRCPTKPVSLGCLEAYSLPFMLLSVWTSKRSSFRVVWVESGFLPLVSPLACFEAAILKGRAAMGLEMGVLLRRTLVRVRRVMFAVVSGGEYAF